MKKTNKKMMILSFIGIIIVVLGHTGGAVSLMSNFFPYYSYHMVLFVFISGYFYKTEYEGNIFKNGYLLKKIKRFIVPYFIWNLIYGIIINIVRYYGIVKYGSPINIKSLFIEPWMYGSQYHLNIASWFILALFIVNILYVILRTILKKYSNDYIILFLFFILAILSIINSPSSNIFMFVLYRTGFFVFFYHLGHFYKEKIEGKIKINSALYLIILILIQIILLKLDGSLSYEVIFMKFKSKYFITPIIASITGILFWMKISEILVPSIGNNKLVNYISNNTYDIMLHHLFWLFAINTFIYSLSGVFNLSGFNINKYQSTIYYVYTFGCYPACILYTILCISMPLVFKKMYTTVITKIYNNDRRKQNEI